MAVRIRIGSLAERLLEQLRRAGERAADRRGHVDAGDRCVDLVGGFAERFARLQIERNRRGDEQSLVIDRQRRVARLVVADGGQRDHGFLRRC